MLRGGAAGSGRARGAGPAARREGERILPPFFNRPARAPSGLAMAPLLGRKPFPLAKPLPPGEQGELFVIPHTQEAFRTREYPPHRGAGGAGVGPGAVEPNKAWWGRAGSRTVRRARRALPWARRGRCSLRSSGACSRRAGEVGQQLRGPGAGEERS